jgi:hypothetical protein
MENYAYSAEVDMTQDEIIEMAIEAEFVSHGKPSDEESELFVCVDKDIYRFAKLVAAKAIAELESQEPVAWVAEDVCESQIINGRPRKIWWECEKGVGKAIYTHPPQRTWVGLTTEDWYEFAKAQLSWEELLIAAETKLKQKNGFAEENMK